MSALRGTNWSDEEVALVVGDYFEALDLDLRNQPFVKMNRYRALSEITGRSIKSIERKFQNISAILDILGRPWINGLAPLRNFQRALASEVEKRLLLADDFNPIHSVGVLNETTSIFIEQPPLPATNMPTVPDYIERLAKKFDPTIRDLRNRSLGRAGEVLAFQHERKTLSALGRDDLSKKVRWVAEEDGDGAGYDILSFDKNGGERFVEVKTTTGHNRTPFFMTRNEMSFAEESGEHYSIFRLFDFSRTPKAYQLVPPFEGKVLFEPEILKATFGQ